MTNIGHKQSGGSVLSRYIGGHDDADNRLTNRWGAGRSFEYDDENRLVAAQVYYVDEQGVHGYRTEFKYDGLGRLRKRWEFFPDPDAWAARTAGAGSVEGVTGGGLWYFDYEVRYVYDGWRVIQERDYLNTPTVSYTRGTDLSGSLEGAGGIGGLLARSHGYSGGNWSAHNFYQADGNGNITSLVDASQNVAASYRYDPFGNLLSSSGSLAEANGYRFSSKEAMYHPDWPRYVLYYYGHRFYEPNLQRWPNRDPIGERGGINLYAFVANNPANAFDPLGLRGKLCVDKNCKAEQLSDMRYVPEDPPVKLVELPKPGECVDVDAVYFPGFAWKIPDNARLTIKCDNDGCPSDFRYRKWPWWLGKGPKWEWDFDNNKPGPKPPKWPGNIPPYPNQPPKEETPK